uniref:PEP-CTERM sorting domain-containing protein n=1 Tax=Okeania sp. SIO2F4 TaxID=2607790 RepID=UPI00260091F0|nr:PEP-CTERM sorting domain-containing protein [Okeania sp. SIO2F4]
MNKTFSTLIGSSILCSAASMLMMAPAQGAAFVAANCADGGVTYNGIGDISCTNQENNANPTQATNYLNGGVFSGIDNWIFDSKVEGTSGNTNNFLGFEIASNGTWGFSNTNYTGPIVLELKGSTFRSYHYFDNITGANSLQGEWDMAGVAKKKKGSGNPGLSHASLFYVDNGTTSGGTTSGGTTSGGTTSGGTTSGGTTSGGTTSGGTTSGGTTTGGTTSGGTTTGGTTSGGTTTGGTTTGGTTTSSISCDDTNATGYLSCNGSYLGQNDSNSSEFQAGGELAEWKFLDKVDSDQGGTGDVYDFWRYDLDPGENNQGTWDIVDIVAFEQYLASEWQFDPTTQDYEIGIVTKSGGNQKGGFSLYNWGDQTSGDWDTFGTTDNGKQISHISLYAKFTAKPKVRVPEPSSIAALAFIGGGMFLSRRRQSH